VDFSREDGFSLPWFSSYSLQFFSGFNYSRLLSALISSKRKRISVERMDSAFPGSLLTAFILFRLQLQPPFECINFFKKEKEGQRLLSGSSFGFKVSLFLLFEIGNCSAISRVVVVLVTIMTPHVGPLMMFRRLAYTFPTLLVKDFFLQV
jgi:hypothetical protein